MKNEKTVKISIIGSRGHWGVQFGIGNQHFTIVSGLNTKKEAKWFVKMLDTAFTSIDVETLTIK